MRFKTIAKLLILLFVFLVIMSGIKTCTRSIITTTTTYAPPPQVPQAPPAPPQQTALQPLVIRPLVVNEEIRELVKGNAVLDIYNVPCNPGDTLPASPVYSGLWAETDIERMNYSRLSRDTVFSQCTLMRLRFFYYAGSDGIYTFAVRPSGAEVRHSMRVNSVQVIPFARNREATGQVILNTGWYEVDVRIYFNREEYPYWYGYRINHKRPTDNQMVVMSKEDIFVSRTDTERLQR